MSLRSIIDQFRYIKIQPRTIGLSTRLWGITTEFAGLIPQSLVLKSIVWDWILIYRNWSISVLNRLGYLGPLRMSPVTGLARLPGRILWCVHIGEISARSTRMNSRNTTKMVEHKLILFATVRTLWTLVTLWLIRLFRILLKWKYIQDQNYTILAAIWWTRSYFVENVSSRSPGWSGEARSRKPSQPGWPGSYEEALNLVIDDS